MPGLALHPLVALLALLVVPGLVAQERDDVAQQLRDERAIRDVFAAYKTALLAGDGATAVGLVDRATIEYYEELRALALEADQVQLRERSLIDRLLVVSMRHELGLDVVKELSLDELIRIAVEREWLAPSSIEQLEMGELEISGDSAFGQAMTATSGSQTGQADEVDRLRYEFVREGEGWRFRFSSLVGALSAVVEDLAAQLGTAEDDLIFLLVESISGRQVLPDVWDQPEGDG